MCDVTGKNCVRFSGVFGQELIAGGYLVQFGLLVFFLLQKINNQKKKIEYDEKLKEYQIQLENHKSKSLLKKMTQSFKTEPPIKPKKRA